MATRKTPLKKNNFRPCSKGGIVSKIFPELGAIFFSLVTLSFQLSELDFEMANFILL